MTVREIFTTWGFKIDDKPLLELQEHVNGLKETIAHLGELILGEGASLFGLAETTADAGVEMQRTAEAVGTTTEKFQELQYAAKQWDVDSNALQVGLRHLSEEAVMAMNGESEAVRFLTEAGITHYKDAQGNILRSDQLLEQVAKHFQGLAGGFDKAGLAMEVLGRGGAELMPILNRLGTEGFQKVVQEGRDLGFIMGPEAIAASEQFKESVNRITAVLVGLRNTIGVALMPAINDMVDKVVAWYEANRELIQTQISQFARELGDSVNGALQFIIGIVDWTNRLIDTFGGLGSVMKVITAGFIAWTSLSTITTLAQMVKTIYELAKAFKEMAFFESLSTGGLTAILGMAAALGAVGIGGYAYSKMGGFTGTQAGNNSNVTVNHTVNMPISLPPGTPQQHAEELRHLIAQDRSSMFRTTAAAAAGGTLY